MSKPSFATTGLGTSVAMTRGESFPLQNISYRPQQSIAYTRGGQAKVAVWSTGSPARLWRVVIEKETLAKKNELLSFFEEEIHFMENTFYFAPDGDLSTSGRFEVRLTSPDIDWQETMLTGQGSPVYDITVEMRKEI